MRVSPQLLARGFFGRSLDEFKRYANIALKQEGIRTPSTPFLLIAFHDQSSLSACKVMSDADIGGFSTANLDHMPPGSTGNPNGCARFHGSISTELPRNNPRVQRTGYAAWRTLDRPATIFGRSLWDIDPYTYLALRIKSDGRKYFVNVQTDSIVPTDLHQHRLFARRPGEWETVLINWNEFVRTNHGQAVEPQTEILRQSVKTVGVGLTDRVPGPFELVVDRIWATNGLTDEDAKGDGRLNKWNIKQAERGEIAG